MKQLTEAEFRKHMEALTIPTGFIGEFKEDLWGTNERYLKFVLSKTDDTTITFDQNGSGHTEFKVSQRGWVTLDRRGVEDSFYHLPMFEKDKCPALNEIVKIELGRIEKRREYYKTAVKIPGLSHTVAPEGIQALKDRLKKDGSISFMPAGFGTGLCVTRRKPDAMTLRFGGKKAPPELEKFLEYSPLWITTFDAD